jgi:integrating conjugative element protein (TIGR03752 family)
VSAQAPNKLPMILSIAAVGILTMVGLSQCGRSTPTAQGPAATGAPVPTPTLAERPSDADSTEATLKTMAARMADDKQTQEEQQRQAKAIRELQQQLEASNNSGQVTQLTDEMNSLRAQNQALMERIASLESNPAAARGVAPEPDLSAYGIPAGAVPTATGAPITVPVSVPAATPVMQWIRPLDQAPADPNNPGVAPTLAAPLATVDSSTAVSGEIDLGAPSANEPAPLTQINGGINKLAGIQPRFTVPVNATLLDAVSMTALIGRVPVNGTVPDSYRFKVLASANNLASSGFRLPPDIKQAVFSGSASGDWALSCVRGQIDSVTVTYEDGTVQSFGGEVATAEGDSSTQRQRAPLGFISDDRGVPCVRGLKVSNAAEVLATAAGFSALEAAARGYAESATDTIVTGTGGVVRSINDAAKFGTYNGIAGAATDAKQIVLDRLGNSFDAIYVPNGAMVALHIERELRFDHNPSARRLDYSDTRTSPVTLD